LTSASRKWSMATGASTRLSRRTCLPVQRRLELRPGRSSGIRNRIPVADSAQGTIWSAWAISNPGPRFVRRAILPARDTLSPGGPATLLDAAPGVTVQYRQYRGRAHRSRTRWANGPLKYWVRQHATGATYPDVTFSQHQTSNWNGILVSFLNGVVTRNSRRTTHGTAGLT
jgi:hypothetical protein